MSNTADHKIQFTVKEKIVPGSIFGVIPFISEAIITLTAIPSFEDQRNLVLDNNSSSVNQDLFTRGGSNNNPDISPDGESISSDLNNKEVENDVPVAIDDSGNLTENLMDESNVKLYLNLDEQTNGILTDLSGNNT